MRFRYVAVTVTLFALAVGGMITTSVGAFSQTAHDANGLDATAGGKAIFKRANCMGCHKWHGNGGGGYGGDALSLRQTTLTREQIIETVGCGRPATGMPYHLRGAYDTVECYGTTRKDLGDSMPPEAVTFLRTTEIEAVADYVIAHIKGKGDPDLADCLAFFGDGSRVCNIYGQPKPAAATTKGD